MAFDTIIRGGRIASSQALDEGDVGISGGKIVAVGDLTGQTAQEVVDAKGLVVMPGVIDTQVHFREPGMEHKEDLESGTRSAVFGGVTTIFEMPNTNPTTTSKEALDDKLKRASGRAWCDYGFFVGATPDNADRLAEYELLPGSPGIKIFIGSSTGSLLVDTEEDLRRVLSSGSHRVSLHSEDEARLRERKGLLSSNPHPREHPFLRDAEAAVISTKRLLRLSAETGRPVHVLHISTGDEIPLLKEAKAGTGGPVSCEVTPQHLYFKGPEVYEKLGTLAQMNPPLRDSEHNAALWRALQEGVFDVFGSDHAPHTLEEKALPYPKSPSGMPGVQTLLPVLLTFVHQGRLRLEQVLKMACETPAQLFGIRDKGCVAPGFDADLVLVDLDATVTFERKMVQSKCGWSPYEGEKLTGRPLRVFLRGKTVVIEGELLGSPSGQPALYTWKE